MRGLDLDSGCSFPNLGHIIATWDRVMRSVCLLLEDFQVKVRFESSGKIIRSRLPQSTLNSVVKC